MFRDARKSPQGLADLLPYAVLLDEAGTVLCKNGSLLAAYRYRGPDLDASTAEEMAALAATLNRVLGQLGDGWLLHFDATRIPAAPYPPFRFPSPLGTLLEEERAEAFRRDPLFETTYVLSLTYLPPSTSSGRWRDFFLGPSARTALAGDPLASFRKAVGALANLLSSVWELEPLAGDALLTHLHTAITGSAVRLRQPPVPVYLDVLLASEPLLGGYQPKVGARHLGIVSLAGLPQATSPGFFDAFSRLPFPLRFSSRWLALSPATAERHLALLRRRWAQKRVDFLKEALRAAFRSGASEPAPNPHADEMIADVEAATAELRSGACGFGYYTPQILLFDEDPEALLRSIRTVLRLAGDLGVAARHEEVNAVEAYLSSLPGVGHCNVRRPLVSTANLAHLAPATAVWTGPATHPSPLMPAGSPPLVSTTTSGTPFRLSLHVGDVGHTLVLGPTGAGKTTLLALLAHSHLRYPQAQVFAFDKGFGLWAFGSGVRAAHYTLGAEAQGVPLAFAPLAHIDQAHELDWAHAFLEVLFELQGTPLAPERRAALGAALGLLARQEDRTLSNLAAKVQDRELRQALGSYCRGSAFGHLLDAEPGAARFLNRSVQIFETSALLERGNVVVVPVLLALFRQIERLLDGRPTLILLDEAWTFLRQPLFLEHLRRWLKELRKKNAAVVLATQSLSDITDSALQSVVFESTATKLFLPNPTAASEQSAPLYRAFGLNDREIERLATATPKADYFLRNSEGARLFQLALGPAALSFFGAGSPADRAAIEALRGRLGDAWPAQWLRDRNLASWADRLDALTQETPDEAP